MLNSNSFTSSLGFSIYVHGCVRVQHLHFYLQIPKMYFFSCHTEYRDEAIRHSNPPSPIV